MFKCQPIPINQWPKFRVGPYQVILAQSFCQKQQGLQGTPALPANTILFFTGIHQGIYFHTRNCHFPIDILSLNGTGKVLAIWNTFPGANLIGPTPQGTTNVIEAPLGWAKRENIKIGSVLSSFATSYC